MSALAQKQSALRCSGHHSRAAVHRSRAIVRSLANLQAETITAVGVAAHGAHTVRGTSRRINEDRHEMKVASPRSADIGEPFVWAGVYDGHGGFATAEWLADRLFPYVEKEWMNGAKPELCISEAYLAADRKLLSASSGFLGMGERGVGGSKCGATAATVLMYKDKDGTTKLLTANVGDARIILCRGGQATVLTEEHVPDVEKERLRIESKNPNPRMPLVRYMGGTWRVGGLLALSRAFGDAYLKGSLQFEGVAAGSDGYGSGFGVIAEPYTTLTTLTGEDSWLVIASDGLFAEEARGGGGGLDDQQVCDICMAADGVTCDVLAETLATSAQKVGSTDDVTVVVMKLSGF